MTRLESSRFQWRTAEAQTDEHLLLDVDQLMMIQQPLVMAELTQPTGFNSMVYVNVSPTETLVVDT